MEYGGDKRHNSLYISDDVRGSGWQWIAETLWEVVAGGNSHSKNGGIPSSSVLGPTYWSFKYVLTEPPHPGRGGGGGGGDELHHEKGPVMPKVLRSNDSVVGKVQNPLGMEAATICTSVAG